MKTLQEVMHSQRLDYEILFKAIVLNYTKKGIPLVLACEDIEEAQEEDYVLRNTIDLDVFIAKFKMTKKRK